MQCYELPEFTTNYESSEIYKYYFSRKDLFCKWRSFEVLFKTMSANADSKFI